MSIKPLPCGCTVTVENERNPEAMGTLQNPLTVKQCATHAAITSSELQSIDKSLRKIAEALSEVSSSLAQAKIF